MIRYEDLMNETFFVIKDLIDFINKTCKTNQSFQKTKAQNAIQTTSFKNLKKIEKENGFSEFIKSKNKDNKIPFFHLGPDNNWKKFLIQIFQIDLILFLKKI